MAEAVAVRSMGYWVGLVGMAVFYVVAGANHFVHPQMYWAIMPPDLPWPHGLVAISGVAEVLGGMGVLAPERLRVPLMPGVPVRRFAAWGIVLMLAAFLPVHLNMVLHPERFPDIPVWALWGRLPLQLPLMGWAWFYAAR